MFVLWQCGCKQHTRHGADPAIQECAPTRPEQQLYSRLLLVPGAQEHRGSAHSTVGAHSIAHFRVTQGTEQESRVHSTEMVHTDSHTYIEAQTALHTDCCLSQSEQAHKTLQHSVAQRAHTVHTDDTQEVTGHTIAGTQLFSNLLTNIHHAMSTTSTFVNP